MNEQLRVRVILTITNDKNKKELYKILKICF